MKPTCSLGPEEVEIGGSLSLPVSLVNSRTVKEEVSEDKSLRNDSWGCFLSSTHMHTCTCIHTCTGAQRRGGAVLVNFLLVILSVIICPWEKTESKCPEFIELKEMSLRIRSRHCKAEGTHWWTTENSQHTALRWSLHISGQHSTPENITYNSNLWHWGSQTNRTTTTTKSELAFLPSNHELTESGYPPAGHICSGLSPSSWSVLSLSAVPIWSPSWHCSNLDKWHRYEKNP